MKTKIFKSVLSLTLALALIFGSGIRIRMGNHQELRPQCDWEEVQQMQ